MDITYVFLQTTGYFSSLISKTTTQIVFSFDVNKLVGGLKDDNTMVHYSFPFYKTTFCIQLDQGCLVFIIVWQVTKLSQNCRRTV